MKKLLVLLAAVLLILTSLTGCSGKKDNTADDVPVLTFDLSTLYIVPDLEATQGTEDALNEYLASIGENYKIHLIITSIGDYFTKIPMELASGGEDSPDIIQEFSLSSDVSNGYLQSLDPYLDNELKETKALLGDALLECGKVNHTTYMIPRYFGTTLDWKWIYNKPMVEAAGVDVSKVTDIITLGDVMAELKVAYPDEHFLVYCNEFPRILSSKNHTAQVGTYAATVGEDTTLQCYYETEVYQQAIKLAYDYRQKGYADPEGSANTAGHDSVTYSGSSKGVIMGHSAQAEPIAQSFTNQSYYPADSEFPGEFGAVTVAIDDLVPESLGVSVTYTCKYPERAASFINLLYTDQYVWDTLIYGVEGRDYLWNDDHTLMKYPEGLEWATVPYQVSWSCGMIGNGFYTQAFETGTDSNSDPNYGMNLMKNAWVPPLFGFNPSNDNIFNEVAAVSNVVDKYNSALVYGDVDPEVEYPKFIAELKEAGIDKIIAEYQAQADEWIKAK